MKSAKERTTLTDPVLRLSQYWMRADLMHEHVEELREYGTKLVYDSGYGSHFDTFLDFWLSGLYVVADGFRVLGIEDKVLGSMIDQNIDRLRLFRNSCFHFQKTPDKELQFFGREPLRLNWAVDLHEEFRRFFLDYVDNDLEE